MRHRGKAAVLLSFCLMLFSAFVRAENEPHGTVKTMLRENRPTRGEPFHVSISVEGVHEAEALTVPTCKDLQIQLLEKRRDRSTQLLFSDGHLVSQEQETIVFDYQVVASTAGVFSFPGVLIRADGRDRLSPSLEIQVHEPLSPSMGRFVITLSKNKVYVNEPVIVDALLELPEEAQWDGVFFPLSQTPGVRLIRGRERALSDADAFFLSLGKERVLARRKVITKGENRDHAVAFRCLVFFTDPGMAFIPQASVRYQLKDSQGPRVLFPWISSPSAGDSSKDSARVFELRSDPVPVEVLPLPFENRPENFQGLVGRYTLRSSAHPLETLPGEPITVTVLLEGDGRLDLKDPSSLWRQPEWMENFEIPRDWSLPEEDGQMLRIVQTVRPRHAGVRRLPPVQVPVFDPATSSYRLLESQPIPLRVRMSPCQPLLRQSSEKVSARYPEGLVQEPSGGAYGGQEAEQPLLKGRRAGGLERLGASLCSPIFLAGPVCIYFMVLAAFTLRKRTRLWRTFQKIWLCRDGLRRIRRLQRLSHPGPYGRALRETFFHLFSAHPRRRSGTLTREEFVASLTEGHVPPTFIQQLDAFLRNLDRLVYGPPDAAMPSKEVLQETACSLVREFYTRRDNEPRVEPALKREPALPGFANLFLSAFLLLSSWAMLVFLVSEEFPSLSGWTAQDKSDGSHGETLIDILAEEMEKQRTDPHERFRANQLAALILERRLEEDPFPRGLVYASLGFLYARTGQKGRAVLAYRRAQRLMGPSREVSNDLSRIRQAAYAGDREQFEIPWDFWDLMLGPWPKTIALGLFWLYGLSASVAVWWNPSRKGRRRPRVIGVVCLSVVAFTVSCHLWEKRFPQGVVLHEKTPARTGPGMAFSPASPEFLGSGTEFRLLEAQGTWWHVVVQSGRRLWIPKEGAACIPRRALPCA